MTNRKRIRGAALVAVISLATAACGGSGSASPAVTQLPPVATPSPSPKPPLANLSPVQPGDRVLAKGLIAQVIGGPVEICYPAPTTTFVLMKGDVPPCSGPTVELTGIDPTMLRGAQYGSGVDAGRVAVMNVIVTGTWDGHAVAVDGLGSPASLPTLSRAACSTPVEGADATADPLVVEDADRRLGALIAGDPDAFPGAWSEATASGSVITVAVVGDLEAAAARIRAVFPYAFCLARADYRTATLQQAMTKLAGPSDWVVYIDPELNRVVVRLPYMTSASQAELEGLPVLTEPLVMKLPIPPAG